MKRVKFIDKDSGNYGEETEGVVIYESEDMGGEYAMLFVNDEYRVIYKSDLK